MSPNHEICCLCPQSRRTSPARIECRLEMVTLRTLRAGTGVDIVDRGRLGECPIGLITFPDAENRDTPAALSVAELAALVAARKLEWETKARDIWAQFHRWPASADLAGVGCWLDEFNKQIHCLPCLEKWRTWIAANPPPTENRQDLFAWTVRAHNAVNQSLGKPQMPLAQAIAVWGSVDF
jgi:hypothetical protein